jgi:hypothetical protein
MIGDSIRCDEYVHGNTMRSYNLTILMRPAINDFDPTNIAILIDYDTTYIGPEVHSNQGRQARRNCRGEQTHQIGVHIVVTLGNVNALLCDNITMTVIVLFSVNDM